MTTGCTFLARARAALSPDARRLLERASAGEEITPDAIRRDLAGGIDLEPLDGQERREALDRCAAVAAEVEEYARLRRNLIGFASEAGVSRAGTMDPGTSETIPLRHRRVIFSGSFVLNDLSEEQAGAYCLAMDALCAPDGAGGSAVMIGPRGGGKTLVACVAALNAWVVGGCRDSRPGVDEALGLRGPLYATTADLFCEQRRWFGVKEGREPMAIAGTAAVLVLDEIQERTGTEWEQVELTRLLDHRYRECLPTILVGNLQPSELKDCLGPSVVSRLQESGALIECNWPSRRKAPATQTA